MNKKILTLSETVDLMNNVINDIIVEKSLNEIIEAIESPRKFNKNYLGWNCVVAIENGGLPFGKYIQSQLNLDLVPIKIQLREANGDIKIDADRIKPPFLLVDDILDSGATIQFFQSHTGFKWGTDFDVATLHWCPSQSPSTRPTYFGSRKLQNEWIIYPWERPVDFDEWWELALL